MIISSIVSEIKYEYLIRDPLCYGVNLFLRIVGIVFVGLILTLKEEAKE
jgi:hypothetical protein